MAVARRIVQRERRLTHRLQALSVFFVALLGIFLLLAGATTAAGTIPNVILLGVGASLVAASAYALITGSQERLEQRFLDLGIQGAFLDRASSYTSEDWTDLLRSARSHYRVLGVANHGYARGANANESEEGFRAVLGRGAEVEILFLDPRCSLAEKREEEEQVRSLRTDTVEAIQWFHGVKDRLPDDDQRSRLSLKLYEATPTCGITWVDGYLLVSHYLMLANRFAPGFILTHESGVLRALLTTRLPQMGRQLAEKYIDHYTSLSKTAYPISPDLVATLSNVATQSPPHTVSEAALHE